MLLKIKLCVLHLFVSDDRSIAVDAWTISFSPDSRFLATGSHSGKINLFGVESGRKEESLDIRGGFTLSIAYVSISLLKFRSQTNWLNVFSISVSFYSVFFLSVFMVFSLSCLIPFSLYLLSFHFLSICYHSVFCLSVIILFSLYVLSFCFLVFIVFSLSVFIVSSLLVSSICLFSLSIHLSYSAIFFSLIIKIWKLSQNSFITCIGKLIKMMFEFFSPSFIESAGFTRYM